MKALLFCKTGQLAGASFEIAGEATIGKGPGNTIQLYPNLISGKHARISFDEKAGCYFIEDLNSRNGTRVDGVRVKGRERLGRLSIVTFANTFDFVFQMKDSAEAPQQKADAGSVSATKEKRSTRVPSPKPVPPKQKVQAGEERRKTVFDDAAFILPSFEEKSEPAAKDEGQRTRVGVEFTPVPSFVEPSKPPKTGGAVAVNYVLLFESLKGGPVAFDINEGVTLIGRDASCTVVVDDGSVSRKHAEIVLTRGSLTLKDLGSKNHTYVDDQRISKEVDVKEGMKVTFGMVKARIIRKTAK